MTETASQPEPERIELTDAEKNIILSKLSQEKREELIQLLKIFKEIEDEVSDPILADIPANAEYDKMRSEFFKQEEKLYQEGRKKALELKK
eukprot:snap_masked-scaffold_1-processed-gene-24.34-mRNA-1 protein AED:1.00 eAED:1.00 QI:0/-1/0/0/-1/1/1/0/90